MLEVYERVGRESTESIDERLILDHLQREKGRFKSSACSGKEVRVFLERGHTLHIGEVLRSQCGKYIQVAGAKEQVITARTEDWSVFSQACYHLGNRHVKLQIGERWLRITPDYVLEGMLEQLGLETIKEQCVFVPEPGAYFKRDSNSHNDSHNDNHNDNQSHSHDHHH